MALDMKDSILAAARDRINTLEEAIRKVDIKRETAESFVKRLVNDKTKKQATLTILRAHLEFCEINNAKRDKIQAKIEAKTIRQNVLTERLEKGKHKRRRGSIMEASDTGVSRGTLPQEGYSKNSTWVLGLYNRIVQGDLVLARYVSQRPNEAPKKSRNKAIIHKKEQLPNSADGNGRSPTCHTASYSNDLCQKWKQPEVITLSLPSTLSNGRTTLADVVIVRPLIPSFGEIAPFSQRLVQGRKSLKNRPLPQTFQYSYCKYDEGRKHFVKNSNVGESDDRYEEASQLTTMLTKPLLDQLKQKVLPQRLQRKLDDTPTDISMDAIPPCIKQAVLLSRREAAVLSRYPRHEVVYLLIDNDQSSMAVSKELLIDCSSYFEALFTGSFREAREGKVMLRSWHWIIIDAFLSWLYTRKLLSRWDRVSQDWTVLLLGSLYVFSDAFLIIDLGNAVIDTLLDSSLSLSTMFPAIEYIYYNTVDSDPVRKLLLEKFCGNLPFRYSQWIINVYLADYIKSYPHRPKYETWPKSTQTAGFGPRESYHKHKKPLLGDRFIMDVSLGKVTEKPQANTMDELLANQRHSWLEWYNKALDGPCGDSPFRACLMVGKDRFQYTMGRVARNQLPYSLYEEEKRYGDFQRRLASYKGMKISEVTKPGYHTCRRHYGPFLRKRQYSEISQE